MLIFWRTCKCFAIKRARSAVKAGWATIDPPTIDPPTIDPPTIDPPTIDPPTIDPPTI